MIDWTDAFDNSSYVEGSNDLPDIWETAARGFRDALGDRKSLDVSYGPTSRETYDVFEPERPAAGTVVFVHGGYWHLLSKDFFSHFASGALARGWRVILCNYPLAPNARISDITTAITLAITQFAARYPGALRLVGHSAGGHLVSRMACVGELSVAVIDRIERIVSISGIHALEPLRLSEMQSVLQLDINHSQHESPALANPVVTVPVTFWVGGRERPEFLRQTRLIAEAWALKGADVSEYYDSNRNHFSVIEGLCTPDSELTKKVFR